MTEQTTAENATVQISELIHPEYNPRKIDDASMKGLKASIKKFGLVQAIIVNRRNNHIVGGNQRVKALMDEGHTEIPLEDIKYVDLDDAEEKALNIALNNQYISGEFTDDVQELIDSLQMTHEDLVFDLRLDLIGMVTPDFEPVGEDEQSKLDEKKKTTCPNCGEIF